MTAKSALRIEIVVEEPLWRKVVVLAELRRAARETLQRAAPSVAHFVRATSPVNGGGKKNMRSLSFPPPFTGEVSSEGGRRGQASDVHGTRNLAILLTGDAKLAALNARFRGKDKPTNVLSFPGTDAGYLGDIAIAYGVAAREAALTGRTLRDHAVHLAVHGVLHLLGYDHETARDARIMEPLEITILAELGISNPYLDRPAKAGTAP